MGLVSSSMIMLNYKNQNHRLDLGKSFDGFERI